MKVVIEVVCYLHFMRHTDILSLNRIKSVGLWVCVDAAGGVAIIASDI